MREAHRLDFAFSCHRFEVARSASARREAVYRAGGAGESRAFFGSMTIFFQVLGRPWDRIDPRNLKRQHGQAQEQPDRRQGQGLLGRGGRRHHHPLVKTHDLLQAGKMG